MSTQHGRFIGIVLGALAALALGSGAAEALDLRSWDQKITDADRRFVVLSAFNNEAVLDKETQLVWERQPSAPYQWAWATARYACESKSKGGRRGWRLPTASELTSLQDVTANPITGMLPFGHPFQAVNSVDPFWSATTVAGATGTSQQMLVNFGSGGIDLSESEAETHGAWCVRGGTGGRN